MRSPGLHEKVKNVQSLQTDSKSKPLGDSLMYARLPFSVVLIGILACFGGCNSQQALWEKYDAKMEIIFVQDNPEITLPAARMCLVTLNEIKKENPNAEHPNGRSVDKLISEAEAFVESIERLKRLQDSVDAQHDAFDRLER